MKDVNEVVKNQKPEDFDVRSLKDVYGIYRKFEEGLNSRVLGRKDDAQIGTIELLLNALFADGHVLFEDYPGSGKSYMADTLGKLIFDDTVEEEFDIPSYNRIQCTPDLLPSDITGFSKIEGNGHKFIPGPVFSYFLLVDEINRTTPKVQSALLEAMAEKQVTVDGTTRRLCNLFFVIATENPLDQVGTFPLPQAQLDRFMFKRRLDKIERFYEALLMIRDENYLLEGPVAVRQATFDDNYKKMLISMADKAQPGHRKIMKNSIDSFMSLLDGWNTTKGIDKPQNKHESHKIRMTDILEGRTKIMKEVRIADNLVYKMIEVADAIEGDAKTFKPGSRPSVRSMQKFIKAAKVRAFVSTFNSHGSEFDGIVEASALHFRDIAIDLLRHRVMFKDEDLRAEERDRIISDIVCELIRD